MTLYLWEPLKRVSTGPIILLRSHWDSSLPSIEDIISQQLSWPSVPYSLDCPPNIKVPLLNSWAILAYLCFEGFTANTVLFQVCSFSQESPKCKPEYSATSSSSSSRRPPSPVCVSIIQGIYSELCTQESTQDLNPA